MLIISFSSLFLLTLDTLTEKKKKTKTLASDMLHMRLWFMQYSWRVFWCFGILANFASFLTILHILVILSVSLLLRRDKHCGQHCAHTRVIICFECCRMMLKNAHSMRVLEKRKLQIFQMQPKGIPSKVNLMERKLKECVMA